MLPRSLKEISFVLTFVDEMYLLRSDDERWVPPTDREQAVDDDREFDRTRRTDPALDSEMASGDTAMKRRCFFSVFDCFS